MPADASLHFDIASNSNFVLTVAGATPRLSVKY